MLANSGRPTLKQLGPGRGPSYESVVTAPSLFLRPGPDESQSSTSSKYRRNQYCAVVQKRHSGSALSGKDNRRTQLDAIFREALGPGRRLCPVHLRLALGPRVVSAKKSDLRFVCAHLWDKAGSERPSRRRISPKQRSAGGGGLAVPRCIGKLSPRTRQLSLPVFSTGREGERGTGRATADYRKGGAKSQRRGSRKGDGKRKSSGKCKCDKCKGGQCKGGQCKGDQCKYHSRVSRMLRVSPVFTFFPKKTKSKIRRTIIFIFISISISISISIFTKDNSISNPISFSFFLFSFFHFLFSYPAFSFPILLPLFLFCFLLLFFYPFSFLQSFLSLHFPIPPLPSTISNSIAMNEVPAAWTAVAYPSMKPCSAWSEELLDRLQFIQGDSLSCSPCLC